MLNDDDPDTPIKSGVLIADYHKWCGSAAMMEITRIHGRIGKDNP